MYTIGTNWEGFDCENKLACFHIKALPIAPLSDLPINCTSFAYLILYILLILSNETSALALWNFASGKPAEGRIPQGESAAVCG
jgi:hypothetical protein